MYTSPSGKSYIGQTIDEGRRRGNWFSSTYEYAGDAINKARAKYGRDSFIYTVLFTHTFKSKKEAKDVLNIMERYYIQKYDTKKNGYNCDEGGGNHFGYTLSKQVRENIGRGVKSWASTPEGKLKMSLSRKGKRKNRGYRIEANFKPVVQLTLDGEFIKEFSSIRDASEIFSEKAKNCRVNIGNVCKGKRDSTEGYKWMYKEDYYKYFLHPDEEGIPDRVKRAIEYIRKRNAPKVRKVYKRRSYIKKVGPKINRFATKIGQYGLDFQLIKVWRCATEAANALGILDSNINRASRTLGKYMGYYWRKYTGEQIIAPKPKQKVLKPMFNKAVVQKDLSDNVITIFSSIGEACESVGAKNRACLSRCLNGKAHTAYGYKWNFLNCA